MKQKHCPHLTGKMFADARQTVEVICCQCGLLGTQFSAYGPEPGHGPFAPMQKTLTITRWPDGNEQCTGNHSV